jgi:hypothetical protein
MGYGGRETSTKSKPPVINHFFQPWNRAKRYNESDCPSNPLRFPGYQDAPWYIPLCVNDIPTTIPPSPLCLTEYFYVIVSFMGLLIYKSLSSRWFPLYYAEESCEFLSIPKGWKTLYAPFCSPYISANQTVFLKIKLSRFYAVRNSF